MTTDGNLDLTSVIKTNRAISGEIVLERLVAKLMQVAMENAGAEQGVLILKRKSELMVEAVASSEGEWNVTLKTSPVKDHTSLPQSIVRYVARSEETVVLGDAANEGNFLNDQYIQTKRPLSVLCLPILHQGRLGGILYLENNLAHYAFSSDRVDVLQLIASDAAVSIENAMLYGALKDSEKKHRALMEAMPDGVMVHSQGVIRFANQMCVDLFGAASTEEVVGREILSFIHPDDHHRAPVSEQIDSGNGSDNVKPTECRIIRLDDNILEVEMSAAAVEYQGQPGYQAVVRDITERKLAQSQMFRAEKMASLGQMMAGVAHEINNPNNFIHFNLPILEEYIDEIRPILDERAASDQKLRFLHLPYEEFIEDIYKLLRNMQHGSKRITDIVAGLKNYVRSSEVDDKEPDNLEPVFQQVNILVGKQIRKTVNRFEVDLADDLPLVNMNAGKIEQVLINLVINASHAADKEDSWVRMAARLCADLPQMVELVVEDNGSGIPEKNLEKIFEPFFTTKSDESGTGLGLAISYQIIEDHKGTLDVTSELGQGTKFTIRLPVYRGGDAPSPRLV